MQTGMDGQINKADLDHLRLLSIFHFIYSGVTAIFSLFPIIHLMVGFAMLSGAFDNAGTQGGGPPPPRFVGWLFVGVASGVIILGLCMAICILITGIKLSNQSGYMFCVVIAALECLFVPLGTLLGVFTLVVLFRPSVKQIFESAK